MRPRPPDCVPPKHVLQQWMAPRVPPLMHPWDFPELEWSAAVGGAQPIEWSEAVDGAHRALPMEWSEARGALPMEWSGASASGQEPAAPVIERIEAGGAPMEWIGASASGVCQAAPVDPWAEWSEGPYSSCGNWKSGGHHWRSLWESGMGKIWWLAPHERYE